jgi:hypothetical protein
VCTSEEVIKGFGFGVAMVTNTWYPLFSTRFGLAGSGRQLVVYEFHEMVVSVTVSCGGGRKPFPVDVVDDWLVPCVFFFKVTVEIWKCYRFTYSWIVLFVYSGVLDLE